MAEIARVLRYEKREEPKPPASSPKKEPRCWYVCTDDQSGLGWVKLFQEEGDEAYLVAIPKEDEEFIEEFKKVGKGWVERESFEDAKKHQGDNVYWLFATNAYADKADELRKAGYKVIGASKESARMEHDREYAVKIAEESGLDSPETTPFTSIQDGLKFLDEHPDDAYVFKPDAQDQSRTYVPVRERPQDANRELYVYLAHSDYTGTFIFQKREFGVEVNVEFFLYEGKPILATMGLESKRKNWHDMGKMSGCAGDIMEVIPLDCPLVKMTIAKMLPFYAKQKWTGSVDVNVIICDGKVFFLEVCDRFGYNAHPNLFLNLAIDKASDLIADWVDGKVEGFEKRFRKGFGASLTLFLDEPEKEAGTPLHVDPDRLHKFFPFDGMMEKDELLLTGYSDEVGIYCEHEYTPQSAAELVTHKLFFNEAVSYTGMFIRGDLMDVNYPNAPIKRHEALRRMGLVCC